MIASDLRQLLLVNKEVIINCGGQRNTAIITNITGTLVEAKYSWTIHGTGEKQAYLYFFPIAKIDFIEVKN